MSAAPDSAFERVVLIGSNIDHSRSPSFHNPLFERYGLPYRYELMPLRPEEVSGAIAMMKRRDGDVLYRGANITSPHKQIALPAFDELSEEARRIGAVNTILFEGGRAIGCNTDAYGFERSLRDVEIVSAPFTAAILGTGGAAMAAVYALLKSPMLEEITIYSRDRDRARDVAARWSDPRAHGEQVELYRPATLLINATPVGLPGRPGLPLPPSQLPGTTMLYEMIYSPAETPLMAAARAAGIAATNGLAMFEHQAAKAFEIWTGKAIEV